MPVQPRSAIEAGFAHRKRLDTTRKLLGLGQRGIVSAQQGPPAQAPTPGPVSAPGPAVGAAVPAAPEAPVAEGGEAPPQTRGQMIDAIQITLNQVTAMKLQQALSTGQIGPVKGTHDWNLDQVRKLMDNVLPVRSRDGSLFRR